MRSMVSKHFLSFGFVLIAAGAVDNAFAVGDGGIPVYCESCANASTNAGIAVGEQIVAQTKILEETLAYLFKSQEYSATQREANLEKTRAAIREEATLGRGSLPRDACGVYAATGARAQSNASAPAVRKDLERSTVEHTRQSRALPEGEPRMAYSITQVIEELDESEILVGHDLLEEKPIKPGSEELEVRKRLQNLVAFPFPVATPSDDEVARIKEFGTPLEREKLAASIALQRRQELLAYPLEVDLERNIAKIDPSGMGDFLKNKIGGYVTFANGEKLSANQLDELLHTYRVNSPEWYQTIATAEDTMLLEREQTMMMAELLASFWEFRKADALERRQQTYQFARETSQAGMTTR